ncbi:hypothetical protein DER46DRAFT_614777 [Fusarium sp. MPI-SDFR-AT-0072]|nr:hypothetical protein DER46DRAFT_614777 [Fusarium sp. MPI-SDFR-AT-0072]
MMVHSIKTAFLFISLLGLTEGFLNDPGNKPPRAGKRTHRRCYRGLSDSNNLPGDPVIMQLRG